MALYTLLALCALLSFAVAQPAPTCGTSGRQCIEDQAECVGNECVCVSPYVWGDGFFACYRGNTVAGESRNDPSLTTFNNETVNFHYPCRYLLTHVRQELKGRQRKVIGSCEFQIHAFNARNRGKIFTHGVDIAVRVTYDSGVVVERSVRKYGTASAGMNNFVVNGVHAYAPNGPFTPSVDIYYKDTPNKVEIKCEEDPVNNQIVFDFKACGIRTTLVPYDIVDRRNQNQIPGLSVGVNCAHHPVWLSNDDVLGLAPVFQGGQYVQAIADEFGLTPAQSMVHRAFVNDFEQNQPDASPSCEAATDTLSGCTPPQRTEAYRKCFWMLKEAKFIKCIHREGGDYVDLFNRCVDSFCGTYDCYQVQSDLEVCDQLKYEIDDLNNFLSGAYC